MFRPIYFAGLDSKRSKSLLLMEIVGQALKRAPQEQNACVTRSSQIVLRGKVRVSGGLL